jgi:hypothetical protein
VDFNLVHGPPFLGFALSAIVVDPISNVIDRAATNIFRIVNAKKLVMQRPDKKLGLTLKDCEQRKVER